VVGQFLYLVSTLFVVLDPVGTAVMFVALTPRVSSPHRRAMAMRGSVIATAIMLVFAFAGQTALAMMGITVAAFRIAGGLLLFLLATDMVFALHSGIRSTTGAEEEEASHSRDISVFPLAIPLLAGPGALTTVMLLMGSAVTWQGHGLVLAALVTDMALAAAALLAAAYVARLLGVTGANVVTRVLGVVLAALATQFAIDGVREVLGLG
jgi:multiple antibiotic resistance protein